MSFKPEETPEETPVKPVKKAKTPPPPDKVTVVQLLAITDQQIHTFCESYGMWW